jgi:hypothetical protein
VLKAARDKLGLGDEGRDAFRRLGLSGEGGRMSGRFGSPSETGWARAAGATRPSSIPAAMNRDRFGMASSVIVASKKKIGRIPARDTAHLFAIA